MNHIAIPFGHWFDGNSQMIHIFLNILIKNVGFTDFTLNIIFWCIFSDKDLNFEVFMKHNNLLENLILNFYLL